MSSSTYFKPMSQRLIAAGLCATLTFGTLAGCSAASETVAKAAEATQTTTSTQTLTASSTSETLLDVTEIFSDRDLDPSYDEQAATRLTLSDAGSSAEGTGVTVDGSTLTITQEGTYIVSGTLSDGQLVVDADDAKVQIVLDGASITSSSSAAIYVKSADKVFLTLADGSSNSVSTTGSFVAIDDNNIDGAIFSKDDLTINGSGSLEVTCADGHGIVVKDDLALAGGNVSVTASGHALQAKGGIAVADGAYTLSAGKDGLHAEDADEYESAYIYVAGGSIDVTAGVDGLDAGNVVQVDGGSIAVSSGDDGIHAEYDLLINDGTVTVSESYEALEGARITVNGGDVNVKASDDGLNASGDPTDTDLSTDENDADTTTAAAEGTAVETVADTEQDLGGDMPADGAFDPAQMGGGEEQGFGGGMRGHGGQMPGGEGFAPTDTEGAEMPTDGETAMGGMGRGQMMGGQGGFVNDGTAKLTINGGTLVVDAGGDGLDSNGDFEMTGGTVYVSGPTNSGNGALDFGDGGTSTITGGTIIAAGSAGMAENFSSAENQGSMLVNLDTQATGTITLTDESGNVLASFTPSKQYQSVVVSAPGVEEGGTYTLACGDTTTTVTMDSLVYGSGQMMGGGMGGFGAMYGGPMDESQQG